MTSWHFFRNDCFVTTCTYGIQVTSDGAGALRAALSSGDWLLTENQAHATQEEAERQVLIPIKSVQNGGLTLDLSVEMGQSLIDYCP